MQFARALPPLESQLASRAAAGLNGQVRRVGVGVCVCVCVCVTHTHVSNTHAQGTANVAWALAKVWRRRSEALGDGAWGDEGTGKAMLAGRCRALLALIRRAEVTVPHMSPPGLVMLFSALPALVAVLVRRGGSMRMGREDEGGGGAGRGDGEVEEMVAQIVERLGSVMRELKQRCCC